jgi:hypothetical protein
LPGNDKPHMTTEAMAWLLVNLKDGPMAARDIIEQGEKMGFKEGVLNIAKTRLKIQHR